MISGFWQDTMNRFFEVIYPGISPDETSWCVQYPYEIFYIVEAIKHFYFNNMELGFEISNEAMARFLIYAEYEHIGNLSNFSLLPSYSINENELLMIAAQINDELSDELSADRELDEKQ